MCWSRSVLVSRNVANSCLEMLTNAIPEVQVGEVVIEDYQSDGLVQEVELWRGKDRVELGIFLGERESSIGPFDGECLILLIPKPLWRSPWNRLIGDIEAAISRTQEIDNAK